MTITRFAIFRNWSVNVNLQEVEGSEAKWLKRGGKKPWKKPTNSNCVSTLNKTIVSKFAISLSERNKKCWDLDNDRLSIASLFQRHISRTVTQSSNHHF